MIATITLFVKNLKVGYNDDKEGEHQRGGIVDEENPVRDEREETVDRGAITEGEDKTLFARFLGFLWGVGPLATSMIFLLCVAMGVAAGAIIEANYHDYRELLPDLSPLWRDAQPLPNKKPRYPHRVDLYHPENQEI